MGNLISSDTESDEENNEDFTKLNDNTKTDKLDDTPNDFPKIKNNIITNAINGPATYQGHGSKIKFIK